MAVSRDPENKAGERLFENPILEFLTKSTPLTIVLTYLPVIVGMIWYAYHKEFVTTMGMGIGLFVSAFFVWTFFEYFMHRWIFHIIEGRPGFERAYQLMHGMHHDHPKDPNRLFMPPVAGLTIAFIFFCFFYLFLGKLTFVFLPGFIVGYMTYTLTHYAMHRFKPPFKALEPLWKHHHIHHFRYNQKAFGVSTFLWDRIFRTMPPSPKDRKKKEMTV